MTSKTVDETYATGEALEVSFTTTQEEFVDAFLHTAEIEEAVKKSVGRVGAVGLLLVPLSLLLAFTTRLTVIVWSGVLLGFIFAALGPFLGRWERKASQARLSSYFRNKYQQQQCHSHNLTVESSGFRDQCPCGRHEYSWKSVAKWFETSVSIVIRFTDGHLLICPKSSLGSRADLLFKMLEANSSPTNSLRSS